MARERWEMNKDGYMVRQMTAGAQLRWEEPGSEQERANRSKERYLGLGAGPPGPATQDALFGPLWDLIDRKISS